MTRYPISFEQNMYLKKGTWTPEEDRKLMDYIKSYGIWNWNEMPKYAGLLRSGKSCRLRWMNYLRPGIKRGNFSKEEEETMIELHKILGNRWSEIAQRMSQRTDNEIKNHWNTRMKKIAEEKAISATALQEKVHYTASLLSLKVDDYISSPESSLFNSPTTGSDHDFDVDIVSAFIKEEKYTADNSSENVPGEVIHGFIKEEKNADISMDLEVLFQDSWEHDPMLEQVMVDNCPYITDEDLMMKVPSQQLGHYEFTVFCDSYSPTGFVDYDFWSSSSI